MALNRVATSVAYCLASNLDDSQLNNAKSGFVEVVRNPFVICIATDLIAIFNSIKKKKIVFNRYPDYSN